MSPTSPLSPPAAPAPVKRRRRLWPWVLGLLLSPFVLLGLAAFSFLTLDGDAAALRRHVMRASDSTWHTRIQFSVGRATLGALRAALRFVHDNDRIDDARLALGAVNRASVGVYELAAGTADCSPAALLADTDRAMRERGWTRFAGVTGREETVLIYATDDRAGGDPVEFCLAVVQPRELVVVSTSMDADALGELVTRHLPADLKEKLHLHTTETRTNRTTATTAFVPAAPKAPTCFICSRASADAQSRTIRFGLM